MLKAARKILVVDDDIDIREGLDSLLSAEGFAVETASDGKEALVAAGNTQFDLVLTDGQMAPMDGYALLEALRVSQPQLPVVLMSAYATVDKAVSAMKCAAADYLTKPFGAGELLDVIERLLANRVQVTDVVAADPASLKLKTLAARVADTDTTVLLSGPSGVGKEVLANFVHAKSGRSAGPFVALNCAAIPENMLEAMLFGYEKGAYTGAVSSHVGKFEQAQGGTLLLDEISEMDLNLQAKLLRVLQERELERLGGKETIALDVRVIATTNRNLREAVAAGRFREDLFYRLAVFPLAVPALKDRPLDIEPLARFFLDRNCTGGVTPVLEPEALARLQSHSWPGNARELDNVIQRALILCDGSRVSADDLMIEAAPFVEPVTSAPAIAEDSIACSEGKSALDDGMRNQERRLIEEALKAGRTKKDAAQILGISPRTLRYKLARLRDDAITAGSDNTVAGMSAGG